MSLAEHAIILVSIIVGLGLTDLLGNFSRLVRHRARVRWDGLPLAWALFALLLVVNYWWGLYLGSAGVTSVTTAAAFLAAILLPTLLYLICTSALPEEVPAQGLDLGESYLAGCRFFLGLVVAYFVVVSVQGIMLDGGWTWSAVQVLRLLSLAAMSVLLFSRRRWLHWTVAWVSIAVVTLRLFTQHLS